MTTDADAYDTWFRAKVQEAMTDSRAATPHDLVLQESLALIDGKRRA